MPQFLTTDEIRRRWIAFFVKEGHKHVPSDSLVPQNDPSVLFTGAGMNQFKEHFLGRAKLDHPKQRAVTVQKCIRTGDIDNVGRTPSHHTFFEMLGNFSFGDYFKKEAVEWGWRFCTDAATGLGLEKERLSVTIFGGDPKLGIEKDTEAEKWWKTYAPELQNKDGSWRIYEYGEHDNFWPADAPSKGPNGPCGPCSEIYYDTRPEQGAPERVAESKDPTRYVEIWNLVFTQFNRLEGGKLEPLSQKNIDTGAGLERMARVVQQKKNNYEIDLLFPIVQEMAKVAEKEYGKNPENDRRMRRITDHIRAVLFCIVDGVSPGQRGRNHVVRRLIRQAIVDALLLGPTATQMRRIAQETIEQMKIGYPELEAKRKSTLETLFQEQQSFLVALEDGVKYLDRQIMTLVWLSLLENPRTPLGELFPLAKRAIEEVDVAGRSNLRVFRHANGEPDYSTFNTNSFNSDELFIEWDQNKEKIKETGVKLEFHGATAFEMKDRFGFPVECTLDLLENGYGFAANNKQFEEAQEQAAKKSQAGSAMSKDIFSSGPLADLKKKYADISTEFSGYDTLRFEGAKVLAIVQNEKLVESAVSGDAVVLLDRTPFYAESGGQVGDKGYLIGAHRHQVLDTKKDGGLFLHQVKIEQSLKTGDTVETVVDAQHRNPTIKNHSATHLLHWALRRVLGTHVEQRGSLVAPERLRFDFTHFEQIKPEFLIEIEDRVNALITADTPVNTKVMPLAEAKAAGAMALFGEKYGDKVRVVSMGPSTELCGGTHCQSTGQIGYFRIVSESSISAGVRRIEALTGAAAVVDARKSDEQLNRLAQLLKTRKETVFERFTALQAEKDALERELEGLRKKAANAAAGDLLTRAMDIKGAKFLAAAMENADAPGLRTTLDGIRKNMPDGAVVLGGIKDGKVALLVSFSPELVKRGAHAGNLLKEIAPKVGGKGGGKPDMAQGGGSEPAKLNEALAAAEGLFAEMLK